MCGRCGKPSENPLIPWSGERLCQDCTEHQLDQVAGDREWFTPYSPFFAGMGRMLDLGDGRDDGKRRRRGPVLVTAFDEAEEAGWPEW